MLFLVIDLTEMPSNVLRTSDTEDVRNIVTAITGSMIAGDSAYEAASKMRFGDKYCRPDFEVHCVRWEDADDADISEILECDLGLRTRRFTTLKRMAEIANNAVDAFGMLFTGHDLYNALSDDLKMTDAEILAAGFTTLKEFMRGERNGEHNRNQAR